MGDPIMTMRYTELRLECLRLASGPDMSEDEVMKRADTYVSYIVRQRPADQEIAQEARNFAARVTAKED